MSTAIESDDPPDVLIRRIRTGEGDWHPTWEYHCCDVGSPLDSADLDRLGAKGWQLCGVVRYAGLITYHFARRA